MELSELDKRLAQKNLHGFWAMERRGAEVKPYLWKWADIYEAVQLASEHVTMDKTGRRAIVLRHPDIEAGITNTLNVSIQLVKPGEIARAHRHVASAIRYVIKGSPEAFTIVEGERFSMEDGDLITTPNWTWHDHFNGSGEPVIWLDGLDARMVQSFRVGLSENFVRERQTVEKPDGYSTRLLGNARPTWKQVEFKMPPYRYPWKETYPVLDTLRHSEGDPFDGIRLQYRNPVDPGPTLLTFSCEIQLLGARHKMRAHRHMSSTVYQVFQGEGATVIEGDTFSWGPKDILMIPPWQWHSHENRSDQDAILFSISDWPAMKALGLYREEARD